LHVTISLFRTTLAITFALTTIGAAGCSSSPDAGTAGDANVATSTEEALSTGHYFTIPQGSYAWDLSAGKWIWIWGCSNLYYSPSSADWGYKCVESGCHIYVRAWYYDQAKLVQIRTDHITPGGGCG
jgi:hypothetical protein